MITTRSSRLCAISSDGNRPVPSSYLLIDEVAYIGEWDRGVKYLADAGLLRGVVLVLTGSDSVLIRDARAHLPGAGAPRPARISISTPCRSTTW